MMQEEQIRQAADALWGYMLKKHLKPYLSDSVCYYRAVVTVAPANGVIEVQRPFDVPVSLPYMWSAQNLVVGDQCTVLVFGDSSNAIVMGDGALQESGSSSGTVTRIATGDGLTGGPITTSGTISASYGTNIPAMDGTGAAGSATTLSRSDHVHPSDTTKQDVLTFDAAPTSGSTNPVTSGGVYTALSSKADSVDIPTKTSDLTNDSGFLTSTDAVTSFNGNTGAVTYTAPVTSVNGNTGAVTVSIPSAADATPLMDGTAAVGTSTDYAREDHVHPSDTTRLPLSGGTMSGAIAMGSNKISGLATPTSDADAATKKYVDDAIPTVPDASTTVPVMDGTASYGSSTDYARADHVHPTDTSRQAVLTFDSTPTSGSTNPVTSGGVYTALSGKQDTLAFDSTPTSGSSNPVTSDGIYQAIQAGGRGGNSYTYTFTTSSWSGSGTYTLTLAAATHGCGTAPMADVLVLNNSSYEKYYGYPSSGWTMSIDTSGNITLTTTTVFSGRIVVR